MRDRSKTVSNHRCLRTRWWTSPRPSSARCPCRPCWESGSEDTVRWRSSHVCLAHPSATARAGSQKRCTWTARELRSGWTWVQTWRRCPDWPCDTLKEKQRHQCHRPELGFCFLYVCCCFFLSQNKVNKIVTIIEFRPNDVFLIL